MNLPPFRSPRGYQRMYTYSIFMYIPKYPEADAGASGLDLLRLWWAGSASGAGVHAAPGNHSQRRATEDSADLGDCRSGRGLADGRTGIARGPRPWSSPGPPG